MSDNVRNDDPYRLTADGVAEPPATLLASLRHVGPGLILAAAIVGTGELVATTHAGAKAGFSILWLVILSCVVKVFIQIELGRHAVSTGETTLASFAKLPRVGPALPWWWLGMTLATFAQISAMVGGVGYVLSTLTPGLTGGLGRPEVPWAVVTAAVTAGLLYVGSYRVLEKTMAVLVVLFTALTVTCVCLLPFTDDHSFGWAELAGGLTFSIPTESAVVLAAVAMIGITGVGASELVGYPYWCIEKGYARAVGPPDGGDARLSRARGWLRVMRLDAWVCLAVYTTVTLAFFIMGAAVLNAVGTAGLPNNMEGLLGALVGMYVPVLGTAAAKAVILFGAAVVLFSTLAAATASNARLTADFLLVNRFARFDRPGSRAAWVRWISVAYVAACLGLYLLFPNPVGMVIVGGFAQALTLPMIAAAAVYIHYRRADGRLTSRGLWSVGLWVSLLAFVAAASYGVWGQVRKLL